MSIVKAHLKNKKSFCVYIPCINSKPAKFLKLTSKKTDLGRNLFSESFAGIFIGKSLINIIGIIYAKIDDF